MRRRKAVMVNVYGGDRTKFDSYVSYYGYVNIPRFKHKKKPISMIKALEVRDMIYHKQRRFNIKNELFTKNFIGLGADMKCYVEDIPGGRS
ncbi:hypothetical protein LSG16_11360 [Lactococcus cremoris]|uniref:hypothetical protein n=1 Tax=Lactococcus lactis subsp. cremoris TaxID=1359 RepID=UPI001E438D28|nr:hypothetical protein [Lactococcus cremoris]MCD6633424.1 hypothetical protein [Lactococcus cremoris]